MAQKLFLDALIGRDDFEVQDQAHNSQGPHKTTLSYGDFEIPGFFFSSLRKQISNGKQMSGMQTRLRILSRVS